MKDIQLGGTTFEFSEESTDRPGVTAIYVLCAIGSQAEGGFLNTGRAPQLIDVDGVVYLAASVCNALQITTFNARWAGKGQTFQRRDYWPVDADHVRQLLAENAEGFGRTPVSRQRNREVCAFARLLGQRIAK